MSDERAQRYVDEIKRIVCDTFELSPADLDASTSFDDVGLSSRQRIRLLATVEVHYGIEVDVDELDRVVDLRGIAGVVADALAAAER